MIGDAAVVALSEAVHCAAEPLEFRNRLVQYLVREKHFTTIAIESGLVESRLLHEYVRGSESDLASILPKGLSWTFDRLPQNRALIEWLTAYNGNSRLRRKINFYGFDLPGSPGESRAQSGADTALCDALNYLYGVDSKAALEFQSRVSGYLDFIQFDLYGRAGKRGYEQLLPAKRDWLTTAIADLIAFLEHREAEYTAASSAREFAWGLRAAVCARQVDNWLRQIPYGFQGLSERPRRADKAIQFLAAASDVRDRAMADNIEWIIAQEGKGAKVLVFAARFHLSAAPLRVSFWADEVAEERQVAGMYLRERLGRKLLTICNVIGEGLSDCGGDRHLYEQAPRDSIDGMAAEIGVSPFLLDLRAAPRAVTEWLCREHSLAVAGSQMLKLRLRDAFDVLFYVDKVTPACV